MQRENISSITHQSTFSMKKNAYLIGFLAIITLFSCKSTKDVLNLYPRDISKTTTFDVTTWKKKKDKPLIKSRRMLAEWEKAQGVLVAYPFDLPINLLQEISTNHKIVVLLSSKKQKLPALEAIKTYNINQKNVEFIVHKKLICALQNIGKYNIVDSAGRKSLNAKFFNRVGKKNTVSLFKIKNDNKTPEINSKAIMDAESILTDGAGVMYADLNLFKANKESKKNDLLRKTISRELGIKELIYVPLIDDSIKLTSIVRLIDKNTVLMKESDIKNGLYLQLSLLEKGGFYKFYTNDGTKTKIVRIKESIINGQETSYLSSLIFNDKIFVPLYGIDADEYALKRWKELMPKYTIIGCKLDAGQRPWKNGDSLFNRVKIIFENFKPNF